MEKYLHLKSYTSVDLHVWNAGCSPQFRSKYVFALTSLFPESFNVARYYNKRHHGKGPMDGISACVKNVVYRAVMDGREVIKSPKEFTECAQKLVKGIHCYYPPIEQVMEEPESIQNALYSTDILILQVHMARRQITRAGFHCVQLFHISL